jgi:hypothetical protein|tara:strand:+ start:298 stop:570 length:273 start_codon:yes stop_codon:yes gene_type:complete
MFADIPTVGIENTAWCRTKALHPAGAIRQSRSGSRDRQHVADWPDPVRIPMVIDEHRHHFDRRSSSAIAKYARALRNILFAAHGRLPLWT